MGRSKPKGTKPKRDSRKAVKKSKKKKCIPLPLSSSASRKSKPYAAKSRESVVTLLDEEYEVVELSKKKNWKAVERWFEHLETEAQGKRRRHYKDKSQWSDGMFLAFCQFLGRDKDESNALSNVRRAIGYLQRRFVDITADTSTAEIVAIATSAPRKCRVHSALKVEAVVTSASSRLWSDATAELRSIGMDVDSGGSVVKLKMERELDDDSDSDVDSVSHRIKRETTDSLSDSKTVALKSEESELETESESESECDCESTDWSEEKAVGHLEMAKAIVREKQLSGAEWNPREVTFWCNLVYLFAAHFSDILVADAKTGVRGRVKHMQCPKCDTRMVGYSPLRSKTKESKPAVHNFIVDLKLIIEECDYTEDCENTTVPMCRILCRHCDILADDHFYYFKIMVKAMVVLFLDSDQNDVGQREQCGLLAMRWLRKAQHRFARFVAVSDEVLAERRKWLQSTKLQLLLQCALRIDAMQSERLKADTVAQVLIEAKRSKHTDASRLLALLRPHIFLND